MNSYRSGQLARLAGVSPDTLRHYERKGILRPSRASNGYRHYPEAALERVLMVRRALALGFSLDELARIFGERDRGGTPCREVRSLAVRKLEQARARLMELEALCRRLEDLLADWDSRLEDSGDGRAELLRSLPPIAPTISPKVTPPPPTPKHRGRRTRPAGGSKGETT